MRVYLSVDLEGVHGIIHSSQTQPNEPGYERALGLMHKETNAVIDAAVESGAKALFVNDAHWDMRNLRIEAMHERATLITGGYKNFSMMAGVNKNLDVACFIGYHCRAGHSRGVLSHTYRAKCFFDVRLNGQSVGETGLNAAVAGHFGVPVALVTGDDALCKEAVDLLPGITTVAVKEALHRYAAVCKPQAEVLAELRSATKRALTDKKSWVLFKPPSPSTIGITVMDPIMADGAELIHYVKRVGDRDIEITHDDFAVVFRSMLAVGFICGSRVDPYF